MIDRGMKRSNKCTRRTRPMIRPSENNQTRLSSIDIASKRLLVFDHRPPRVETLGHPIRVARPFKGRVTMIDHGAKRSNKCTR